MKPRTGHTGTEELRRSLTCAVESEYPVAVIHLTGRLDSAGVPDLRTSIGHCLSAEPDAVVLDVADLAVPADDCAPVFAGLCHQAMTWPGSAVVFVGASPSLLSAVRRSGCDIASYPSVAAARAGLDTGGPRYRLREALPASPVAAPVARRLLSRVCRSWSVQDSLEPAELVATELVANAVRHAGSRVTFTVSLRQGNLQISVGDDSPVLPRQRAATALEEHGRGLLMLDALCRDWGMTCVGDGKVVWARVPTARA